MATVRTYRLDGYVSDQTILLRQILTIIAPFIITLVRGFSQGYSTTLLPELKRQGVELTLSEESWIASITIIGGLLGGILAAIIADKIGRKPASMISFAISIISWSIFLLPTHFSTLFIARLFSGISGGFTGVLTALYLLEVSHPKFRGLFMAIIGVGLAFGIFLIHAIDTFLHWKITALIAALLPITCFLTQYFCPESPQWLAKNNKKEQAIEAFHWLRGYSEESEEELQELLTQKNNEQEQNSNLGLSVFKDKAFWKITGIISVLCITTQCSGYNSIEYYSVSLAQQAFGSNEYQITLLMDFVRIIFSIVACYLSKKLNRRPHAIWTGIGSGISMLFFALCLAFPSTFNSIIQLLFLLGYISLMTAGLANLLMIIGSELFPYRMRGSGMSFLIITMSLLTFLVVKTGPQMFASLGMVPTYALYGICCLAGSTLLYFILPETKDRKLSEIENC